MPTVVSPVVVGREQELAAVRTAVQRTVRGEPGIVLVGGEAGVGKSRLVEAALEDVEGVRVLSGSCVQLGGEGLPFVPLVDALRTLTRTTDPGELDRVLGPARTELARLLPELAPAGAPPAPDSGSTAQLFELLLGVLTRVSQDRPLVLVVEDLHWADRSTLDLVAFLVRTLGGARVLLVLSYRAEEVDRRSPLRPLLSTWERLRNVEVLALPRLSRAQVAAQVGAIVGTAPDRSLLDVVFERSEGNPFFVEELVRTLREGASEEELPPSLRDVLLARAERLSAPAQRLLRTAAVAGRWVPERLLAEVSDIASGEFYDALREAVDASLLVVDPSGRGYAFRHALTRDAVYQDLLPGERVDLHTSYAQALERDPLLAGDDAQVAATLAVHWYAAHDLPRSLAASVRAGREFAAAFAPAEARRHLERALEVWRSVPDAEERAGADKVEVLCLAARAVTHSGEPQRALSLLQEAGDLLDPAAYPERMALVVEQRAATLRRIGEDDASLAAQEDALRTLPDRPGPGRAALLASLANTLMRIGDPRAVEVARSAIELSRAVGARAQEASALITLGSSTAYLDDADAGEAAIREGLRIALVSDDQDQALRGYVNLSDILEARDRHEEAADLAAAGIERARSVGQYGTFGVFLLGNQVEPMVRLGRWDEAERLAREGLAAGPSGFFPASLLELLSYLAVLRGAFTEALELVARARRSLGESREPQYAHALAFTEAEAARAAGDPSTAGRLVAESLSDMTDWSPRYAWPLVWLGARIDADEAVRARDLGTAPPAARVLDSSPMPSEAAGRSSANEGYRLMTAAEQLRRDGAPAGAAWEETIAAWERAGHAWPLSYARFRLAEALCAQGRRDDAAGHLRAAVDTARRLGAAPLLDDALALARRARVPLDDETPVREAPEETAPPFALTDREREVLALVAAGRSNGQIAAALFISPKTASVHVSNILAKLGVSGRVEAAGVAHRLGLVQPPAERT